MREAARATKDEDKLLPQRHRGRRRSRRRKVEAPTGTRHQAAGAPDRGQPDQGTRGPGHRPAVDLRVDHRDDPRPRLLLQEGHGPGADLHRVRRRATCSTATWLAWLVDYTFTAKMEDDLDEISNGRNESARRTCRLVLPRQRPPRPEARSVVSVDGEDRPAQGLLTRRLPARRRSHRRDHRGSRRALRPVPQQPAMSARPCPTSCAPDELDRRVRAGPAAARPSRGPQGARQRRRDPG